MKRKAIISLALVFTMVFSLTFAFAATTTKSRYTGKNITHNDRFDNALIVDGVDVSAWQEDIDWKKAKADGVDFAIIRIAGRGYGTGKMYADAEYAYNMREAKKAGVMVGVYFFSQAVDEEEAVEEAEFALKYLNGEELDLPVFMDYEFAGGTSGRLNKAKLSKAQMTKNAEAFCKRVEAAGYEPGVYANLTFLNNSIDGKALSGKYMIWAAQYYNMCQYEYDYDIWQYSSSGKVSGISGNADVDVWYMDKKPKASTSKSIADCDISFLSASSYLYNSGKPIEPDVIVEHDGIRLTKDSDYKLSYIKNTALGTGYVVVQGKGAYSDRQLIPFSICSELPEDMGIHANADIKSSEYRFGDYVTGVDLGSDVSSFWKNITLGEGLTAKLTNASGKEINSGKVGTGMKLAITDSKDEIVGVAPIVIKGDCSGDGICDLSDLLGVRKQIMSLAKYGGAQFKSLDINDDGKVDLMDLLAFRKHIMGIAYIKD